MMSQWIKRAAHWLLNYDIYRIYEFDTLSSNKPVEHSANIQVIDKAALTHSANPDIASQDWYGGNDTMIYAYKDGDDIAAIVVYWFADRYRTRNFWPLQEGQAKLVQVYTLESHRGRGLAPQIISYSAADMGQRGFTRLYARVWHSNEPSHRAFTRSLWKPIATVIQLTPLKFLPPIRWVRRID